MKKTIVSLLTGLVLVIGNASAQNVDESNLPHLFEKLHLAKVITIPVEQVFIPGGFDSNDISEVVVKGTLPNSCWKVSGAGASFHQNKKWIKIHVTGFLMEETVCLPVTSTFVQSVKLGQLAPADDYKIEAFGKDNQSIFKKLSVKLAERETVDDYMYAQVDSIHLIKADDYPVGYELQGRLPPMNGECLAIDKVTAKFDASDVLTVLPIMKVVPREECTEDQLLNGRPFFKRLYQTEHPETFLIHARSINGQSVNRFVPAH